MIQPSLCLGRALLADAIFSDVSALFLSLGASPFANLLELPEMLLRRTGLFLIAYAALVGWLATRQATARDWILIVIAGNAVWTVASIALLFSVAVSPRVFGEIVIVLQAIVTGILAELQYVGLRKSASTIMA